MTETTLNRDHNEFPRRFVPEDLDLGDWEQIGACYKLLRERDLSTLRDIERWLADLSELQSALGEEHAVRYIQMTCHTDDPAIERAYLHFIENITPKTESEHFALARKYLDAPGRRDLAAERYFVFNRARENEVAIYRDENVPLQTRDAILSQQYQKICGEMTANFKQREHTIPQLTGYLEETDRNERRAAWLTAANRQLADRQAIESIFDEMISLRDRMAHHAGFPNFIEYQFRRLGRFDYTAQDCLSFHEAIEKAVMPLQRKLRERRKSGLGLPKLAPWDLDADPLGLPPLRPFSNAAELEQGVVRIFAAISPLFEAEFTILRERHLLDLESRKGKAPGGYQITLDEARQPFIFMNAADRNQDLFTLFHEGGHAFHALATRYEPLFSYRSAPIEFAEVGSMGMEMMAYEKLDAFYDPGSAARARRMHLEDIILLLPWIARVDAFQHWIYANPGHSRAEREARWITLDERFGDDLDWSELPEWRACSWYAKMHFFCVPLYYIEYGIAQLGALQLWERYLDNPQAAIEGYRVGLKLGGSKPLPDIFITAGLRFNFRMETLQPLMSKIESALDL